MERMREPEKRPRRKPMTKERLSELATPKNPLPKISMEKNNVLQSLPPASAQRIVKPVKVSEGSSRMSDVSLVVEEEEAIGNAQYIAA